MGVYRGEPGLRAFRADVANTLVDQELSPADVPFRARLSAVTVGGIGLVDAEVSPVRSRRRGGHGPDDGGVFLLRARRADGLIEHGRGAEPIRPDRLVVVPAGESFAVSYRGPARLTFLALPGPVVAARFPQLAGAIRSVALSPFAQQLFLAVRSAAPGETAAAATVLDALLGTVTGGIPAENEGAALRAATARLVDEHIGDPRLGVPFLAARLGVSVRSVHRAFEESGETVAASIRSRRLDAASSRLRQPGATVSDVAAGLGFASASRFAAQFRARYGCSPSSWRTL